MKTRDIRLTVKLRADPQAVYRALTSARELKRWWVVDAETEPHNAGYVRMVWPDGSLGECVGVFADLEPAKKVAWLFEPRKRENGVPSLVSVFIGRRRGLSEVTLIHAGFPMERSCDGFYRQYACAWQEGLTKLKQYLAEEHT